MTSRARPIPRPRLASLLDARDARRVALLVAPSGYGVTTTLRELCGRTGGAYVTVRENSSLARFAGDLAEVLAGRVPGLQMTLTAAYERALDARDPTAALAAWFSRHAEGLRGTLAIDHLDGAGTADVSRFVAAIVQRSPGGLHWAIGSQALHDLPVASWLAHGLASVPHDERDLALDAEEALEFARLMAPGLPAAAVAKLLAATRGCVADFVFLLRTPRAREVAGGTGDVESAMRTVFGSLSRPERNAVLRTALLPALDDALLAHVRMPRCRDVLRALRTREAGLFSEDGTRYDGRFGAFLRRRLTAWSEPRRTAVAARTAAALAATGDLAGALDLYVSVRAQREVVRIVESYAFRPAQSAVASILHDALGTLDVAIQKSNPAVLTLRALSAALHERSDVAEVLFQHALSRCRTPAETISVRYLYAKDLLRRERLDALALLQPDETFFAAPEELRVAVMASLGVAHALDGLPDVAEKWVGRALRDVGRIRDGAVRARVYHQVSYVALTANDVARAVRFAERAVKLGAAAGEYEVAASACSVLYSVAADFDDDPGKAASYLSRIATYGAKCGSSEKQLMAWVAAYEIEAERGNDAAVASIERELGEFDVHYSARLPSEGLLPAQVLKATWNGDFARAFRTLSASAELLQTADREALRWAEIAVYAAAAGETKEAVAAVRAVLRTLKKASASELRPLRARLYCALALILLGRTTGPRLMLAAVHADLPAGRPRLAALYEAVAQLARFRAGDGNHQALSSALDALREHDFGGVARMFESFPAHALRDFAESARSA